MTTYILSRRTPVDIVACGGKEKQQVIISKQHSHCDNDHSNVNLELHCKALSALDGIVIISHVLSNTTFKMPTYRLSRRTPVDSVACGGKEKQQVIISKQHNYAH